MPNASKNSQHHLHALRRCAYFGIVFAGLGHDGVDACVGVVRVVVKKDEFLYAAFHHDIYGFAPVAVAPALFAGSVFVGQVLGVIDQNVSAFSQFAHVFIKDGVAGFIVSGVNQHFAFGFHAETETALRMVEPHGVNGAMVKGDTAFVDIGELAVRRHLIHLDGKIGIGHLLFQSGLQAARLVGRVKDEGVIAVAIERREKRDALDVVPVKVREKNVCGDRVLSASVVCVLRGLLLDQLFAQIAEAGAAIENINVPVDTHLNTGGIAPITQVF